MSQLRSFCVCAGIIGAVVAIGASMCISRDAVAAWSEPQKLGPHINSGGRCHFPFVTADGQRLYWSADGFPETHGLNEDIYVAVWDSVADDWGPRQQLGEEINTNARELSPCESPDRQYLWFTQYNGAMYYDLYYSIWDTTNGKWGVPVNAGPQFNSECVEWSVSISPDGKRMFLVHGIRPGTVGCEGEVLWVSYWNESLSWWDSLIWMGNFVNIGASEYSASMSSDTSVLYIATGSVRPGVISYGLPDVQAFRYNPPAWDSAQSLGVPPNSNGREESAAISPDGRFLYFSSNRDTATVGADIYVSERSVSVEEQGEITRPSEFELRPAWPNPFNAGTSFEVTITTAGRLSVGIYTILGRKVSALHNDITGPGVHQFSWADPSAASGVYFVVAKMGGVTKVRKVMLLK